MTHAAQRSTLNFGTAAEGDGEMLFTAMPKIDTDIQYIFNMLDTVQRCCSNILALQDMVQIEDGDAVMVLGYHAAGDGGGQLVYYSESSTAQCDGITVWDGVGGENADVSSSETWAGTGTGRFLAANPFYRTAPQCGMYADGSNEAVNTIRLNAALGTNANLKHLFFPAGTYDFDGTVTIDHGNITLEGVPGQSQLILNAASTNFIATANNLTDLVVRGLRISSSNSGNYGMFFLATSAQGYRWTIENCQFDGWTTAGALFWGAAGSSVRNNLFYGNTDASFGDLYFIGGQDGVFVEGNRFLSDAENGIYWSQTTSGTPDPEGVVIQNNYFNTFDSSGNPDPSPTYKQYGIRIAGASATDTATRIHCNDIYNTNEAGIYCGGSGASGTQAITIRGNYLRNNGVQNTGELGAIHFDNYDKKTDITDNTIEDFAATGSHAAIWIDAADNGQFSVRNNKIINSGSRGIHHVGATKRLWITGNDIECAKEGIYVLGDTSQNSPNVRIANNSIYQNADVNGIYIDSSDLLAGKIIEVCDNVLENDFSGTDYSTQGAIVYENASEIICVRNTMIGHETGIRVVSTFAAGRHFATQQDPAINVGAGDVYIADNRFQDVDDLYTLLGADSTSMVPVFGTQVTGTYTNFFGDAGGTGTACAWQCTYVNGLLRAVTDNGNRPENGNGTWNEGDRFFRSDPNSSGSTEYICYTAGSPGDWRTAN